MLIGTREEKVTQGASTSNCYKAPFPLHLSLMLPCKEIQYIWDNLRNASDSKEKSGFMCFL